jgi:hypothetical protein
MWKHLEKEEAYVIVILTVLAICTFTYVIASDLT